MREYVAHEIPERFVSGASLFCVKNALVLRGLILPCLFYPKHHLIFKRSRSHALNVNCARAAYEQQNILLYKCTLSTIQYTVYTIHCILYIILYTIHYTSHYINALLHKSYILTCPLFQ